MEIIIGLIVLWFAWILFKGKYQRDRIRESLDDIRINATKAPFRYMVDDDRMEFFDVWPHLSDDEKNKFVGRMIMLGLASQGLEIKHIPLNIRLGAHFGRTLQDVKDSLDHMTAIHFARGKHQQDW